MLVELRFFRLDKKLDREVYFRKIITNCVDFNDDDKTAEVYFADGTTQIFKYRRVENGRHCDDPYFLFNVYLEENYEK